MLRFATGAIIIAIIYIHSPARQKDGLGDELSRRVARARDDAAASFIGSTLGRDLAVGAMKGVATDIGGRSQRSGTPAPATKPANAPAG